MYSRTVAQTIAIPPGTTHNRHPFWNNQRRAAPTRQSSSHPLGLASSGDLLRRGRTLSMGLACDPGPSASRTARRRIRRVAGRTSEACLTHIVSVHSGILAQSTLQQPGLGLNQVAEFRRSWRSRAHSRSWLKSKPGSKVRRHRGSLAQPSGIDRCCQSWSRSAPGASLTATANAAHESAPSCSATAAPT
jgi:hypothetical protein